MKKKHLNLIIFSIVAIALSLISFIFTCLFTHDTGQTIMVLKSYFSFSSIRLGELTAMIFIILMFIIETKLIINNDSKILVKSILNFMIGLLTISLMFNVDVLASIYGSFSLRNIANIAKIATGIIALLYVVVIIYYYKHDYLKLSKIRQHSNQILMPLAIIALIISSCVIIKGAIKGVEVNKHITAMQAKANKLLASDDLAHTIQQLSNLESIKAKDDKWEHVSTQHFDNGVPFYFNYQYKANQNAFISSDSHYIEVVLNIKDITNHHDLVYYDVYLNNDLEVVKYYKTDNFDEIANRNELEARHNKKEISKLQSLCSDIVNDFLDDVKESV